MVLSISIVTLASQASDAVALPQVTTAGQLMVVLAGQVMEGAVLSVTDTERLQVEVLPQSSVARYVRVKTVGQVPVEVVSPRSATSTEASQASLAVTTGHTGVAGQAIVVLPAHVMAGAVLSVTVTERLQVEVLPQSSVAR